MSLTVVAPVVEVELLEVEVELLFFDLFTILRCASAGRGSSCVQRLPRVALLVVAVRFVEMERRLTRSRKMGVGARKARRETRKAVTRRRGERVWYRWLRDMLGGC